MKVLLIEDEQQKHDAIKSHLESRGVSEDDIIHASNMTDFAGNLKEDIGLFIIDFNLPSIDNAAPTQNGRAILETIIKSGNQNALLLAISSYPEEFKDLRDLYEAEGCILADFNNQNGWQSTLDNLLIQLKLNQRFDFVIFCALQEERNPYITIMGGKQVIRNGIDCFDVAIDGATGTIVLLPKMGLVNAAVVAGMCINKFMPSFVGMSGICGGFKGRANIGQLFVSSMAYEYQTGKWASDGFQQEPYQVKPDNQTLTSLNVLTDNKDLLVQLEEGFTGDCPPTRQKPKMGIFTSGSAVIADQTLMNKISNIHRKVNALDMEVFAVQRAAELSSNEITCVCAKTVVDLGNMKKNDKLHGYGSYISAKYMIRTIEHFLKSN